MDEELTSPPEEESAPQESAPQRRRRRTKEQIEADNAAQQRQRQEKYADLPPFAPELGLKGHVSATAKRVVRTGQYESFDLVIHVEYERDPRHSVMENIQMLSAMATQEVNRLADQVQSQIQVEK